MSKQLKIISTFPASADYNMHYDKDLLEKLDLIKEPTLHLYDWEKPSFTYGYFINPLEWLDMSQVSKQGFDHAKRPTGGGIVFHHVDLAFSFLMPSTHSAFSEDTLENYGFVNQVVAEVVEALSTEKASFLMDEPEEGIRPNFCMAKPTVYDVMLQGKKVGGAAQRRTKKGYLHQGTISLQKPDDALLGSLLKDASIFEDMKKNTFFFLSEGADKKQLDELRTEVKELLRKKFEVAVRL